MKRNLAVMLTLATGLAGCGVATETVGETEHSVRFRAAVQAVSRIEPMITKGTGTLESTKTGPALSAGGTRVTLPATAGDWVRGETVRSVHVAGVATSVPVQVNDSTVIYPDTAPGVSTAVSVAVTEDESVVETFTILHDAAAPSEHRMELAVEDGEQLVLSGDRSAEIVDEAGNVRAAIDAPWARDAQGRDVPLSLGVDGNAVVLTVPHQGAGFAYPIVVDPKVKTRCGFWTCSLIFSRSLTRNAGGGLVSAVQLCKYAPGWFAPACALVVGVLGVKALHCAKHNKCLELRIWKTGGFAGLYCDRSRQCVN